MDLVLPPLLGDAYPFAEERRLFYVAHDAGADRSIPGNRCTATV